MKATEYVPIHGFSIDLEYLADGLADDLTHSDAIDFILRMDARKADLHFTQKLYACIGDELRKELEVSDEGF